MIEIMNEKIDNLRKNSAFQASWLSFSKKRQSNLIDKMIEIDIPFAKIENLYSKLTKKSEKKLAKRSELIGILVVNDIEKIENQKLKDLSLTKIRSYLIKNYSKFEVSMKENDLSKARIRSDTSSKVKFSISRLIKLALDYDDLMTFLIEMIEKSEK